MLALILRVDFLETENKKLENKILDVSNQLAVLERRLQTMQSLYFPEVLGTDNSTSSTYCIYQTC